MKYGTLYAYWTHEWSGDYIHYAKKVAELGFDILEISAGSLLEMSDRQINELRATAKDLGLIISSNIGPPKDKDVASKDPEVRKAGIKFLSDIMLAMDKLNSRSLVGVINTYWPSSFDDMDKAGLWARGVESVRELTKLAENLGIDYCIETVNRFESSVLNTSEEAVRFCKDVDSPRAKVLLDTFHMNIEEDSLPDAIRHAGDYLGHLHVGEGNRKVPGQGHLPWAEIGQALRDINYDKGVVMEPFVHSGGKVGSDIKVWRELRPGATEVQLDAEIRTSLAFLKHNFEV
ncbi:MAG: sugar phosphate isomerase/epimerase family protein [Oscillospiraceae bacterium]